MRLLSAKERLSIKNHYGNDGNIISLLNGYEDLLKFYNRIKNPDPPFYEIDEEHYLKLYEYGGEA